MRTTDFTQDRLVSWAPPTTDAIFESLVSQLLSVFISNQKEICIYLARGLIPDNRIKLELTGNTELPVISSEYIKS